MKNRASGIVKKIIAAISSIAKAKTMALKSKTTALKTRIAIFSLLRNKKILMTSISHKLQALVSQHGSKGHSISNSDPEQEQEHEVLQSHKAALVLYTSSHNINAMACECEQAADEHVQVGYLQEYEDEVEEKYPDLTHSLFDEVEDTAGAPSVIDMVKNSKEEAGEEFRLEDEIDHVADLFIKRFHRQIMFQKQQSLKRNQEMLLRTA
ncbi:uncharacterized protein LOC125424290 [Ziziphus jujuba]|uniref:Uncharacterized protein LOC125424290 n=1 Tax=Ziziphus jujuba TaxID=326968 RepID=A0ABM3IWZ1_ZIZJJ|nr:uncharacterized protein LOC125424290 [Ziziphus jujuba]